MLITGGSRGIGAACVVQAAEAGYDICFSYVANPGAADLAKARVEELGARAAVVKADVSIEADVINLFDICES